MEFLQGLFSRIRGWFTGIWEKTEKRDRTRFLVISGVAVVLIAAALIMLNNARYTTLAGVDNPSSRRAAAEILSENGIRSKTSGNDLLVNKKDEGAAMAALMQSDIPINDLNFEIYKEATGLTATDADRRMFSKFQKEAQLKWMFESLPAVDRAIIIIDLPENKAFFRQDEKPMTVTVTLHLNAEISKQQIDALESAVKNATNVLPENITLMDSGMSHLNLKGEDSAVLSMLNQYEFTKIFQQDLVRSLSHPLNLLFGSPNFSITVNADFDFDEISSEIISFTPVNDEDGIVRSFTTLTEFAKGAGYYGGQPGTDEDGLGDEYPAVDDLLSEYRKAQETTNYEINQIIERINRAPYRLRRISASVLINTDGLEDVGENTEAVQALIGAGLCLPPNEYGNVEVRYLPMNGVTLANALEGAWKAQQQREETFSLIQTLVLYGIVGICVILLILRTFSFLKPKPVELPPGLDLLAGDADEYSELLEAAEASTELEITKTPTRERIEEFIEHNAEAVASMLRSWLQEEDDSHW